MSRYNPKGNPKKQELELMAIVKQMPCFRCGSKPVDVHHLVECGRRLGGMYVLPLCKLHHKNIYELTFAEQMEECRKMYKGIGLKFQEPPTKIVRRKI